MASSGSFDEMTLPYSRCMRLIAILPFKGRTLASMTSRVLLVYCFISSLFHWTALVVYIMNHAETPAIDTICEMVISVGVNARCYLLPPRRHEFADLLSERREIWRAVHREDRRVVRRFERKVRMLFLGLLFSGFFVNVLYSLSAVARSREVARQQVNGTRQAKHYLPYKWYIDDVEDLWPGYEFNFALQVIVVANASVIAATVDSAAPLLIMITAGYFGALRQRLYRLYDEAMKSEDEDYSRVDFELVSCWRLHQRILRYCTRINEITRTLFFVQLICTGYNTSLIGIKLAGIRKDPDKYKYMPVVLLNLGQMFICQWAPDHLLDESEAISKAAYFVSVPCMKRRVGKLLILMIARAQRPAQMTAAGLVNLSLENFGSMLKGAVSFFTVLRNFNV